MGKPVECVDCLKSGHPVWRPTPKGGPRSPLCVSCWKARKRASKQKSRESRWMNVYNLTPQQYQALYVAQGGKCLLCTRATGATRALSVEHDHATGRVRSLCCRPCNDFLGHMRDDPDMAQRFVDYLKASREGVPFAVSVIGEVFVNEDKIK